MDTAEDLPSSQKEIPSKPEASQESSGESTTATSSMAAANQPDNETVAEIKEPQPLERDQSVDEKGEEPMDTSPPKEESESKKEQETNLQNTPTQTDMPEGERPFLLHVYLRMCVHVTYVHVRVCVLLELPAVAFAGMLPACLALLHITYAQLKMEFIAARTWSP